MPLYILDSTSPSIFKPSLGLIATKNLTAVGVPTKKEPKKFLDSSVQNFTPSHMIQGTLPHRSSAESGTILGKT